MDIERIGISPGKLLKINVLRTLTSPLVSPQSKSRGYTHTGLQQDDYLRTIVARILGVDFSCKLLWISHINRVLYKIRISQTHLGLPSGLLKWNALPVNIMQAQSLSTLKRLAKSYYRSRLDNDTTNINQILFLKSYLIHIIITCWRHHASLVYSVSQYWVSYQVWHKLP